MQNLLLTISILNIDGEVYAYAPAIAKLIMPLKLSNVEDAELVIRDFLDKNSDTVINPLPPISIIHQTKLWLRLHGYPLSSFISYITITV